MTVNSSRFADWLKPTNEGGVMIGEGHVRAHEIAFFLNLVCETAYNSPVIILPRLEVKPGGERADKGWMVRPTPDGLQIRVYRELPADEARTLACVIASYADVKDQADGLDESQVERLTAFLDEAMDVAAEDLARSLLTAFDLRERAA